MRDLRPDRYKLREDLVIKRRVFGDEVKYVVKDPIRLEYWTIDEVSYGLLSLCDGERDLEELVEAAQEEFPDMEIDALTLLSVYESYRDFKFFEDPWERNILLIEKRRKSRKKMLQKGLANPFEIHFPAWNPDEFFGRIVEPLGFLFTKRAVVVYALIFAAAMWISLTRSDEFALPISQLYIIKDRALLGIVTLWVILFFSVVLHEIGHGLTTKRFGGGVYKIGFLLLYFQPCLYCDTTESYFFENKRHKYAVMLAGGVVDLMVASFATFFWFLTSPDLFLNQLAHRVALYNGVAGILVNFNPLMKYDGYFVLSDYLEMPNLQDDSFRYLGNRVREIFGLPHEPEPVTPRQRRVYGIYGTLSILYVTFVLSFIYLLVSGWLVGSYRAVGYVLAAALLILMTKGYVKKMFGFARFFALDKAGHFRRFAWLYGLALVALIAAVFLLPVPRHVRGEFALRPGDEAVVRAREAGIVEAVHVSEGERVEEGSVLFDLSRERIRLERGRAEAARRQAETARAAAFATGDRSEGVVRGAEASLSASLERFHEARATRSRIEAPLGGVVLTPRLWELVGAGVEEGETLCEIGALEVLRAEVLLDEQLLGLMDPDATVELRPYADPSRLLRGRVVRVSNEPVHGEVRRRFRVLVDVENAGGELRPGMSGMARFDAGSVPPARHLVDWLSRTVRIDFWL